MSELYPDVVVTAGGTRESIDDVRYITNFSTGEFGHALAGQFAQLGHRVLLLAPDEVIQRFGTVKGVTHRPFTSAESLRSELLSVESAKLVFQAAAVSDYAPVLTSGKISSDNDELVLTLKRVPKILPQLRGHFGLKTVIVGFKLLSGVTEDELVGAGVAQIVHNRTDYCIANDLQKISAPSDASNRTIHFVHNDGSYETTIGSTDKVAQFISQKIDVNKRVIV